MTRYVVSLTVIVITPKRASAGVLPKFPDRRSPRFYRKEFYTSVGLTTSASYIS